VDTSVLEDIGLTNAEIKVYLALLELGSTKIGRVIQKADIQSSVAHNTVHSLLEKGLITYVLKGKIKHYAAADPHSIGSYLEEKKNKFERMLPELLAKQNDQEKESVELFVGYRGLSSLYERLIRENPKANTFSFFGAKEELRNDRMELFYRNLTLKMHDKKIKIRGLQNVEDKEAMKNTDLIEVRYASQELPPDMGVLGNGTVIMTWGETPRGIYIQSKQISKQYQSMFNDIWKIAK